MKTHRLPHFTKGVRRGAGTLERAPSVLQAATEITRIDQAVTQVPHLSQKPIIQPDGTQLGQGARGSPPGQ